MVKFAGRGYFPDIHASASPGVGQVCPTYNLGNSKSQSGVVAAALQNHPTSLMFQWRLSRTAFMARIVGWVIP
jgi:hypothetical protein